MYISIISSHEIVGRVRPNKIVFGWLKSSQVDLGTNQVESTREKVGSIHPRPRSSRVD